jgi:glucokinase
MSTRDASAASMPQTVIGVDVGGTKVSVALLHHGKLADPVLSPTDCSGPDALVDQIVDQIEAQREDAPAPVEGVGIGVPSVVEFATGRARSSVNIPLSDVPLREVLEQRLGIPVFVDNDATCAALAEAHDEQGELDVLNLVMFTVGTGVGGGLVLAGRVYRGSTGAAGEVGHTLIGARLEDGGPEVDDFPQPGSLERLAAGRALDALARRAATEHPDSALGRILASTGHVTGRDAVDAAHAGDEPAIAAIATLGHRLGVGVANAINTFDPDVVAIGGGVSRAGDLLLGPVRETALPFVLPGVGTRTEIRLARSGPVAGVRGAALLARQELAAHHLHHLHPSGAGAA